MKNIVIILFILVVAGGSYYLMKDNGTPNTTQSQEKVSADLVAANAGKSTVPIGKYTVVTEESTFSWSAKKPLVEGYVNSGTIDLSGGTISITDQSSTGSFTIDMNTLSVGLTAKKPGKEGALEEHLKTDDFFDVEKYPTSTFTIKKVEPNSETNATFTYLVTGDLTMKGSKNEISFPAQIYMKDGKLVAEATFEIDRTKWGLTYGSGNFFQNLGNNLIDDMVAISFTLIAK